MSRRSDRLAEQARIEQQHRADAHERQERHVPPPAEESPDYCGPNMKENHRHSFYRSRDGKRRCYWCMAVRG